MNLDNITNANDLENYIQQNCSDEIKKLETYYKLGKYELAYIAATSLNDPFSSRKDRKTYKKNLNKMLEIFELEPINPYNSHEKLFRNRKF